MEGCFECNCWRWCVAIWESGRLEWAADFAILGPAHAVYFGTYEVVKDMAGGNVDEGHHPLAAGRIWNMREILEVHG